MSCVCVDYQTVHACGVRVQNYVIIEIQKKSLYFLFTCFAPECVKFMRLKATTAPVAAD